MKKKKKRRKQRRFKRFLFLCAFVFAIIFVFKYFNNGGVSPEDISSSVASGNSSSYSSLPASSPSSETQSQKESSKTGENLSGSQNGSEESTVQIGGNPADEWAMILVNHDNAIPDDYSPELIQVSEGRKMEKRAGEKLLEMLEAGRAEGLSFYIVSAYRSVNEQTYLFNKSVEGYMQEGMTEEEAVEETAKSIAYPGMSEHNLGLAVDIVTGDWYTKYSSCDEAFADTPEGKWLAANSQNFGFILRYPKDKQHITKIIFEPWHFRYVGVQNAKDIKATGLCLEEYLQRYGG